MRNRIHSLDALRGLAILLMIMASCIAWGPLPAWMYHTQLPPPTFVFNNTVRGLTWVDVIFPFFLFSMGAAIPLSIGRKLQRGVPRRELLKLCLHRYLKLLYFALFVINMYPASMGYPEAWQRDVAGILAFGLLFIIYLPHPFGLERPWNKVVNYVGYAVGLVWLILQPYSDGQPFYPGHNEDGIILILAICSFVGGVVYLYTSRSWLWRLAILPPVFAILLSATVPGSWQQTVLHATPAAWAYEFRLLQYLFITLFGTIAGDLFTQEMQGTAVTPPSPQSPQHPQRSKLPLSFVTALLATALIVVNICLLFGRLLVVNILVSIALVAALLLLRHYAKGATLDDRLIQIGSYLLLFGLCLEAFQGGIRKEEPTVSYLVVTCGLSFLALEVFVVVSDRHPVRWLSRPLEVTGQNPMVAYAGYTMAIIPALRLAHIFPFGEAFGTNALLGFLQGIILTTISLVVTWLCTRKGKIWKT